MILAVVGLGCESLPEANLRQMEVEFDRTFRDDSMIVDLGNPSDIPLRIVISSSDPAVPPFSPNAFVLQPKSDSSIAIAMNGVDSTAVIENVRFSMTMGDPSLAITDVPLAWPFPEGRTYRIIQGYNGSFSHNSPYSRYAIDFDLAVGDTVTAADNGFVVGVIDGYDIGGSDRKYRPFANFITVYHPHSRLITQYVHLESGSSTVAVGDSVSRGQPLGTVGITGFTTVPHLHFNVLMADSSGGMVGRRAAFLNGALGADLNRDDVVSH